jgi:membrane-associated phospholipid phosphatase
MPNEIWTKLKRLTLASLVFWLPVILFSKIAGEVAEKEPILLDNTILHWIHTYSTHLYDTVFLIITTLGNVEIIAPLALLTAAYFWYKHQRSNALLLFFGFFGAGAANAALKLIFHRNRPTFWRSAITETGFSFPSGHAMLSSAFALSIIVILWQTRWRWWSVVIGGLFVVLVGYSRLYLGVHYPSDIIAGWAASLIWVSIVVSIIKGRFIIKSTK